MNHQTTYGTKRKRGDVVYKTFKGSKHLRQCLVLATLARMPLVVKKIRSKRSPPGLLQYERSLLTLLQSISDGSVVEFNKTGTRLRYIPGILVGGDDHEHDCGLSRSIGYFLEPLIILGLFGQKPLSIMLQGITNDSRDPSVDTFKTTTLRMLQRFGIPAGRGLNINTVIRGIPPLGGGLIRLCIPIVRNTLSATCWIDKGKVERIRGTAYSISVSPRNVNKMISVARENFKSLTSDVYVLSDYGTEASAGKSLGYGVCLVAETTTNCLFSTHMAVTGSKTDEMEEEMDENSKLMCPEELGKQAASMLLDELKQGVVDSTHQDLLFTLCALCPHGVSEVRVGKLTRDSRETIKNIRDILGVTFVMESDTNSDTILVKCEGGLDIKNLPERYREAYM